MSFIQQTEIKHNRTARKKELGICAFSGFNSLKNDGLN